MDYYYFHKIIIWHILSKSLENTFIRIAHFVLKFQLEFSQFSQFFFLISFRIINNYTFLNTQIEHCYYFYRTRFNTVRHCVRCVFGLRRRTGTPFRHLRWLDVRALPQRETVNRHRKRHSEYMGENNWYVTGLGEIKLCQVT